MKNWFKLFLSILYGFLMFALGLVLGAMLLLNHN